jgi:glycine/D-amino acid oxidase-like deaminating enzyme
MSPKKLDVPKNKEKNIVVVGAGIIGLSTAYYLSKNP